MSFGLWAHISFDIILFAVYLLKVECIYQIRQCGKVESNNKMNCIQFSRILHLLLMFEKAITTATVDYHTVVEKYSLLIITRLCTYYVCIYFPYNLFDFLHYFSIILTTLATTQQNRQPLHVHMRLHMLYILLVIDAL